MSSWQQRTRGRDTLQREIGYVRKVHGHRLRVALAFPNSYFVGMSSLGFQAAYRLFNEMDTVVCERVFLPPRQEVSGRRASPSPLRTLESGTPVSEFDILAFSVSFEWDYTNVLTLLRLAGLPIHAVERDERHPLVVVGGAVTFLNPEPLAPFADVFAVGEGEVLIPTLVNACGAGDRRQALQRLARAQGFYVPSLVGVRYHESGTIAGFEPDASAAPAFPVRKAVLAAAADVDPPVTTIFTPDTEFGSRLLIEPVRGCPNLCRFCWAGYHYLPVRPFDAGRILRLAEAARPYASRVGLVSIALCDHPDIHDILAGLHRMGYGISPASLRLDDLTEPIVRILQASGERTLTIAPEAGSDRLRRVINKAITNDEILDRADLIFACGIENLKLYYLVGLPTETDEDLVAIQDLTLRIRGRLVERARARGAIGRISISVNPLVPKPGTAFQWLAMEDAPVTDRKIRRLRSLLAGIDNVYVSVKSERHTRFQALLSLGDRRVAPAIEAAERNGGDWRKAIADTGIDADFYVARDRSADPLLPWDVLGGASMAAFLRTELAKSQRGEITAPLSPRSAP
ncbi:MAG: radical SAM protein [Planctomycetes bacterium]|nr:radical SAM protein [Planctomycetota bacterium]